MAANKEQIAQFFVEYQSWLEKWQIIHYPNHIWNVDECGLPDVPKETRVIGEVGKKAFQTVAGEKGTNSTLLCFVSAGGLVCPPLLILKGSKVQPDWREATPTGYMVRASPTGYINQDLFAQYGERFIKFLDNNGLLIKDTGSQQKNLLLLDMHKSHLFNIKFMKLMQEHNIEVCSFPPHCTHVLQPLDDVPFARFKSMYNTALLDLNYKLAGRKMSKPQMFRMLVPTFTAAMSHDAIVRGFKNTGIYPVDPSAAKLQRTGPSIVYDKCEWSVCCVCLVCL